MTAYGKRIAWIAGLFSAALVVALAPPSADDGLALSARTQRASQRVEPARREGKPARDGIAGADSPSDHYVLLIKPRVSHDEEGNDRVPPLFAATRWAAAAASAHASAPPVPTVTQPVPLQAPALPFRVLGRYDDGGRMAVFLQQDDRNFVVHVGDVLDERYKVERLDGATLTLRYLPLNQLQSLDVGGGA